MSTIKRKSHASYDKTAKRFRDAFGRFIRRDRGLKSKYARTTYLSVIRKGKAPPLVPKPRRIAVSPKIRAKPGIAPPRPPLKPKPTHKAKRKKAAPVKRKKAAPVKRKKAAPVKRVPRYMSSAVAKAPGQRVISGVGRWGKASLATLLLQQIKAGYTRFRFWYKIVKTGFIYKETTASGSNIGSTYPVDYSVMTKGKTFDEIVDFLNGKGQNINGKVIYYWMSKR